jgi:hypothetical protein
MSAAGEDDAAMNNSGSQAGVSKTSKKASQPSQPQLDDSKSVKKGDKTLSNLNNSGQEEHMEVQDDDEEDVFKKPSQSVQGKAPSVAQKSSNAGAFMTDPGLANMKDASNKSVGGGGAAESTMSRG